MADTILILGNGFDLAMGRKTSYKDYKAETADALNPLSYKKHIKEAYTKLIEEVIEPLRVGR